MIKRAAEHHEVMAAIHPCPKPGKAVKGKRTRQKTNRQKLTLEMSDYCRKITAWLYGDIVCVEADIDGGRCGKVPQWGHVIPQGLSSWLRHSLSNFARQCDSHNILHKMGDPTYSLWYIGKFGKKSYEALRLEYVTHIGRKRTIPELVGQRDELLRLWEDRHSHGTDTLEELAEAGYFGEIVKEVWTEEGRI